MIEVVKPGLMTTVQDQGRPALYRVGIAPSGAMDLTAFTVANALVENAGNSAALEYTYLGPTLVFRDRTVFAVAGGDADISLNGVDIAMWAAHEAHAGDVLTVGIVRSGVRGYIAVRGGIDVATSLGSRSTHVLVGIGGIDGRKLETGTMVPTHPDDAQFVARRISDDAHPQYPHHNELRYVPGLFDYCLTDLGRKQFIETEWTVSPAADRTGIRMISQRNEKIDLTDREQPFGAGSDPWNVVDAGYPIGAIQLPNASEPIVLARDAVTAGGYLTVGTVISSDLDVVGQLRPHSPVTFNSVSLEDALLARTAGKRRMAALIDSIQ